MLMIKKDQGLSAYDERRSRCSRKIKVIKLMRLKRLISLSLTHTPTPCEAWGKAYNSIFFQSVREKYSGYVESQTRMVERLVSSVLTWQPVVSEFVYQ